MKTVLLGLTYVAMVFVDTECPTVSHGLSLLWHCKLILQDGTGAYVRFSFVLRTPILMQSRSSLARQTLGKTRVWSNSHSDLVPTCPGISWTDNCPQSRCNVNSHRVQARDAGGGGGDRSARCDGRRLQGVSRGGVAQR